MKATEKQVRYIRVLADRAGKKVPEKKVKSLSKDEASKVIDRLQAKVGVSEAGQSDRVEAAHWRVNDALFGLSAKLVWQLMLESDQRPSSGNFPAQVISLYQELARAKTELGKKLEARSK